MIYTIDKKESRQIMCLRAICVIMVILLHQYAGDVDQAAFAISGNIAENELLRAVQYVISRIISSSAVPLFFLMSSVLLYAKEFTWKDNMKKKTKSLIIPYFIWITLYIIVYFVGQTFSLTSRFFANSGRYVSQMNAADFLAAYTGIGGSALFVNALWFLRDLIIMNALAPVIRKVIDRFPGICLVLLALLWNVGEIPEALIINKQSIVFFSLGYYVVKYNVRMQSVEKFSLVGLSVVYLFMIILEYSLHTAGNMLVLSAHSFTTITGIVLLVRLSASICRDAEASVPWFLQIVGDYSFFIYVSHDFVQTAMKKICAQILPQSDIVQMAEYFLIPVLVCVVCIAAASVLRKLLPSAYRLLTGSRKQIKRS